MSTYIFAVVVDDVLSVCNRGAMQAIRGFFDKKRKQSRANESSPADVRVVMLFGFLAMPALSLAPLDYSPDGFTVPIATDSSRPFFFVENGCYFIRAESFFTLTFPVQFFDSGKRIDFIGIKAVWFPALTLAGLFSFGLTAFFKFPNQ